MEVLSDIAPKCYRALLSWLQIGQLNRANLIFTGAVVYVTLYVRDSSKVEKCTTKIDADTTAFDKVSWLEDEASYIVTVVQPEDSIR